MRALPLFLAAGLTFSLPAAAGAQSGASPDPKIANGLVTSEFPAVGLLFGGEAGCTATLIGCRTVLTAAHCVSNPASQRVYFQNAGTFAVASAAVHPGWNTATLGDHDLALLRLAAPVSGVQPVPLNPAGTPAFGTAAMLVGFGRTSTTPHGIKRSGRVELAGCLLGGSRSLCYDFQAPLGPPGTDSTACPGDSGGPMFVDLAGGLVLAGVTSGGVGLGSADCTAPLQGIYSDVFADRAWIELEAAGDPLGQACGNLPGAGSAEAPMASAGGTLGAATPESAFTVEVPAGTKALSVQLNAESGNDFDLYVKRGALASPASFDCRSAIPGAAPEGCTVRSPASGTWHLTARRAAGEGLFQVTATTFAEGFVGPCLRDATTACLGGGRFEVTASWQNPQGTGTAGVMSFGGQRAENDESAFFYFQSPTNFEIGVKVLNACIPALGNQFWVFLSGLTDQGWTVRVRDSQSGAVKTYTNAVGRLSSTFADTAAFRCS